jgi:uncharacterized Tic20 family protein
MLDDPTGDVVEAVECSTEQRQLAALCHFAGLPVFTIVGANIIAPLVIWLLKKDTMPFVDAHGKESLNFQITIVIAYFAAGVTTCLGIGVALFLVVAVLQVIFPIIAGIKAWDGKPYRYPLTLRVIS